MEGEPELDPPSTKEITFAEWADELCPYYMAMGVSCNDYWYGDYSMLQHYVKTHEMLIEQKNQDAWWQGMYIHKAVDTVIINRFCKKKGEPQEKYPDKPIRITPLSEQEKEKQAEAARQKIINDLTGWGNAWKNKPK